MKRIVIVLLFILPVMQMRAQEIKAGPWVSGGRGMPFYYTFRESPVAFVVFDAGETGRSRSLLFSVTPVYEEYLQEQIAWARKAPWAPASRSW